MALPDVAIIPAMRHSRQTNAPETQVSVPRAIFWKC